MSTQVKLSHRVVFTQINPGIIGWLFVVSCILLPASTSAEGAVFLSRSGWAAAAGTLGPIIVEDFDAIPQQVFGNGTTANLGMIPFDITLFGGPGDPKTELIGPFHGGNGMLLKLDGDNVFRIDLDFHQAIYGFAADWTSTTTSDDLVVTAGIDECLLGAYLGYDGGDGFFGIIPKKPFTRIGFTVENLTAVGEDFWMDNLRVVIPEPATMFLFGLGSLAFLNGRK